MKVSEQKIKEAIENLETNKEKYISVKLKQAYVTTI